MGRRLDSSKSFVKAYRAPNSTTVKAGIRDLDFGSSTTSAVGAGATQVAARTFSPNGDGSRDSLKVRWRNAVTMASLKLNVYRTDGTLVGSRSVPRRASGAQSWSWNGEIGGKRVKDGRYVLQLQGTADGRTYRAPSARPTTATQVARYVVRIDTTAPAVTGSSARYRLISPNGDGTRDATKLTLASKGGDALERPDHERRRHGRPRRIGERRQRRLAWNGRDDAGARVPRRAVHGHAHRVRRCRQQREALVGADGRHHAARRQARRIARGLLAQRRRRARHDRALVDGNREGDRHRPAVEGNHARPVMEGLRRSRPGRPPGTGAGPTARASRTGSTRSRWT